MFYQPAACIIVPSTKTHTCSENDKPHKIIQHWRSHSSSCDDDNDMVKTAN